MATGRQDSGHGKGLWTSMVYGDTGTAGNPLHSTDDRYAGAEENFPEPTIHGVQTLH